MRSESMTRQDSDRAEQSDRSEDLGSFPNSMLAQSRYPNVIIFLKVNDPVRRSLQETLHSIIACNSHSNPSSGHQKETK